MVKTDISDKSDISGKTGKTDKPPIAATASCVTMIVTNCPDFRVTIRLADCPRLRYGFHMTNFDDFTPAGPTNTWECQVCGKTVERYRGEYDVTCVCGAEYNASGQRLRDNWRNNSSNYDDDMDDMEGYERASLWDDMYADWD